MLKVSDGADEVTQGRVPHHQRAADNYEGTGCAYFRNHTWTWAEISTNIALFGDQLGWVSRILIS